MDTILNEPNVDLSEPLFQTPGDTVTIRGQNLTINEVVRVARYHAKVQLTDDPEILGRLEASHEYIMRAAKAGKSIYGVTTGFGAMAHTVISPQDTAELQDNLIWFMKSEAGKRLAKPDVRAAMMIRANSHLVGLIIQDRYSLRCLPQYLGAIVDAFKQIAGQVTIEINSATDNPLIDPVNSRDYHGGNFLGQYIGVAMDQLRYHLGLLAKHLDAQIALLVAPEFSNGLPPSLIGNSDRKVNMGLKGLQICGNSIMPMINFFGNSLVDRFPTHAEQFNQNINSQGFGSATLARQSIEAFHQYMAVALMFGIQAVDLRTYPTSGHYDARSTLSSATRNIYETVRQVVGQPPSEKRPYIRNDHEQMLSEHIRLIATDIAAGGQIPQSVEPLLASLN